MSEKKKKRCKPATRMVPDYTMGSHLHDVHPIPEHVEVHKELLMWLHLHYKKHNMS